MKMIFFYTFILNSRHICKYKNDAPCCKHHPTPFTDRITTLTGRLNLPTSVASSAANSCSTGFGYAPAPQARLRRRLEKIHGAYVCLIDEFNTSQKCCSCHQQLKPGVTSGLDRHGEYHHRNELHGVRCCENCHNAKGSKQFWHRDYNAAMNILACYMAVASGQKRPDAFDRSFN